MPVIFSSSSGVKDDGVVFKSNAASFADARDATSGTTSMNSQRSPLFVGAARMAGRGGRITYTVYRSFMVFDTSSITSTVASAELSIRGYDSNDGSIIAVKSTAFGGDGGTALAAGDFDAITGWSAGSSLAGSATVYGAQILTSSWSLSGYNDFTATSDLLSDMKNNDVVIICFMDYTNDYLNSALTSNAFLNCGGYYAEHSTLKPHIDYTLAGYANNVKGVAAANIAKVNGVATANISKVNGI